MPDLTLDPRLATLEAEFSAQKDVLAQQNQSILALAGALTDLQEAHRAFREDIQATLGPIIRQIQGESGLSARLTTVEARLTAAMTHIEDLQSFDTQQKRGPSPQHLADELADLKLTLQRLHTADKYALTREKLGRLMIAHNLVSPEELAQSDEVNAE